MDPPGSPERLTCGRGRAPLLRFDPVGEAHLDLHTRGPATAVLALVLRLLQVDLSRVEGQLGAELGHVPGPGHTSDSHRNRNLGANIPG